MPTEQTSIDGVFIQGVNTVMEELRIFSRANFVVPLPLFLLDRSGTQTSILASSSIMVGKNAHVLLTASFQLDVAGKWFGRAKAMLRESSLRVESSVSEVLFEYFRAGPATNGSFGPGRRTPCDRRRNFSKLAPCSALTPRRSPPVSSSKILPPKRRWKNLPPSPCKYSPNSSRVKSARSANGQTQVGRGRFLFDKAAPRD